jgi:hypothetical protein
MPTSAADAELSRRNAAAARKRWADTEPGERQEGTRKATAVSVRRRKAATELLRQAERVLTAAGAEVRWP